MFIKAFFLGVAAAFSCPKTEVINRVPEQEWNLMDKLSLQRARSVCADQYGPRGNPCLKKFEKKQYNTYNAICGAETKK